MRADLHFGRAISRFPFDPYAFCGTDDTASALGVGRQKGQIDPLAYVVVVPQPQARLAILPDPEPGPDTPNLRGHVDGEQAD